MTHVTHPIFVTHLTHDPWPIDPFPALPRGLNFLPKHQTWRRSFDGRSISTGSEIQNGGRFDGSFFTSGSNFNHEAAYIRIDHIAKSDNLSSVMRFNPFQFGRLLHLGFDRRRVYRFYRFSIPDSFLYPCQIWCRYLDPRGDTEHDIL